MVSVIPPEPADPLAHAPMPEPGPAIRRTLRLVEEEGYDALRRFNMETSSTDVLEATKLAVIFEAAFMSGALARDARDEAGRSDADCIHNDAAWRHASTRSEPSGTDGSGSRSTLASPACSRRHEWCCSVGGQGPCPVLASRLIARCRTNDGQAC